MFTDVVIALISLGGVLLLALIGLVCTWTTKKVHKARCKLEEAHQRNEGPEKDLITLEPLHPDLRELVEKVSVCVCVCVNCGPLIFFVLTVDLEFL